MSILAIDYGKKRIGLAVSSTYPLATPLKPVLTDLRSETMFAKISEIIKEYSVGKIVVGLPLNMNDTESDMTKEARSFADVIEKKFQIKVDFADERQHFHDRG